MSGCRYRYAPAIVAVQLDPIGAMPDLVAHHTDQAVDAVGLLGALRHAPFQRESFGRVTARRHDGARGGENSRTRDDALIHRLLEFHIGVTRALGAQIADRRSEERRVGKECRSRWSP